MTTLQTLLSGLGFYNTSNGTGFFGPITEAAVIAFQSAHGFPANGIVGASTWAALRAPPPVTHPVLHQGDSGSEVTLLQQDLTAKGFSTTAITGYFGVHTEAAVRAFQASRGLSVTGVVAQDTWAALLK